MADNKLLELFPLTRAELFRLPDLVVDKHTGADTYKSLFMNELVALEVAAKRCLVPANYIRHPDGSANLSVPDIILDVSTLYLFAHKTLVSTLFIFVKTLPRSKSQGIKFASFSAFTRNVQDHKTDVLESVYKTCGKQLSWAQETIIDKRDDLVQHWQGNESNKFFTKVYAWDLPYLIYYNPAAIKEIDERQVDSILTQVKNKVRTNIDSNSDALGKIAWMEAWLPKLNTQLQKDVKSLCDNKAFITLPVTPQLIAKLDEAMAGLLAKALSLRSS